MSRMAAEPSARPGPKKYTHRSSAGTGASDREGVQRRGVPRPRQIVFRNVGGAARRAVGQIGRGQIYTPITMRPRKATSATQKKTNIVYFAVARPPARQRRSYVLAAT